MRRTSRLLLFSWLAGLCVTPGSARGLARPRADGPGQSNAGESSMPRASAVVEPHAYVSLAPVPRGHAFELAVVAKIRPGFHINAHEVSQEYLIPTALETQLPLGFRVLETLYPRGVLRKFKFSPLKLSVYEGSVTLRMKLEATPTAPLGRRKLSLTLAYQACNQEACLPPTKLPVWADLDIAPADTPARPSHPDIFRTQPRTSSPH